GTPLNADCLSGAPQLAADDGAQILASASGRRTFDYRGLADGDEVNLGGLTLRAWATPGHTFEHVAYLLLDGGQLLGVFTGGALLVGAGGRPPLSRPGRGQPPAPAQDPPLRPVLPPPAPPGRTAGAPAPWGGVVAPRPAGRGPHHAHGRGEGRHPAGGGRR